MNHTPAQVIAALLMDGSGALFTAPAAGQDQPLYVSEMPDGDGVEDDCGCVYDTTGSKITRIMATGHNVFHEGIQIRIRSMLYTDGAKLAADVSDLLSTVLNEIVTIEGHSYYIQSITQPGTVMSLGQETQGTKRRELFTLNCLVFVDQLS